MQATDSYIVQARGVSRRYRMEAVDVDALTRVDARVPAHGLTVFAGASGSGKTTLLNLIGCIDRPDEGSVEVNGRSVADLDDDALSDFRARHIGFVFQSFNLLPVLTAAENVEYPLILLGEAAGTRRARVAEMLDAVGLAGFGHHKPGELSGGQRQRVAVARALVKRPLLVIADEPTANLDSVTGAAVIDLMRTMQTQTGTSFVISSHDPRVIAGADQVIRLRDGRIDMEALQ